MSEEPTTEATTETDPSLTGSIAKGFEQSKMFATKSLFTLSKSSKFVWHTALGSAATAEENLVSFSKAMATKGAEVESKAKSQLSSKFGSVKDKAEKRKESLSALSKDKIASVEKILNKGVNKSLHAVGVPTKTDMDKLAGLMGEMSKSIEELTAVSGTKSKRTASKAATP